MILGAYFDGLGCCCMYPGFIYYMMHRDAVVEKGLSRQWENINGNLFALAGEIIFYDARIYQMTSEGDRILMIHYGSMVAWPNAMIYRVGLILMVIRRHSRVVEKI